MSLKEKSKEKVC